MVSYPFSLSPLLRLFRSFRGIPFQTICCQERERHTNATLHIYRFPRLTALIINPSFVRSFLPSFPGRISLLLSLFFTTRERSSLLLLSSFFFVPMGKSPSTPFHLPRSASNILLLCKKMTARNQRSRVLRGLVEGLRKEGREEKQQTQKRRKRKTGTQLKPICTEKRGKKKT